ncbi:hypothetical protein [Sphingobium phenoxybenzoativorans]|uniref:hypothetical protein n=1 Tax=Sphingobium phenoxybenzoativorans TaxID=1592790 RepID=UPI0014956113|nr:hypothetical protein [Sphingobium phenoxybenzoativorans]
MNASEMSRQNELCWKQFSLHIFELARWPGVALIVAVALRTPVERILEAIALGLHS